MRAGAGWSLLQESKEAGREAARLALRELEQPAVLFVFTTSCYKQEEVLAGVLDETGDVPLVGACGAGIITPAGIFNEGIAVLALAGDRIKAATAITWFDDGDPWDVGKRLGKKLLAGSRASSGLVAVFPDGLASGITEMLQGLYDIMGPGFKYAGGGTGDNLRFIQTYQLTEKCVASSAVAAAIISGCVFGISVEHGWKPMGPPLVITRARGKVVHELDARPAFTVYAERLGGVELEKMPKMGLEHPLGMPNAMGRFVIRDPMQVLPDGAIELATEVPSRAVAYLMHAKHSDLIEVTQRVAAASLSKINSPAFALLFNCVSRSLLLKDIELEHKIYREVFGALPFAGLLTFGEVAAYNDVPIFHNKTLVAAVGGAF